MPLNESKSCLMKSDNQGVCPFGMTGRLKGRGGTMFSLDNGQGGQCIVHVQRLAPLLITRGVRASVRKGLK